MRSLKEIKDSGKIFNLQELCGNDMPILAGEIFDRKERICFTLGQNENGWEHVAISIGNGRKTPSWEVMCKAKKVFWRDDEEVVQLHPKESEYFHGFAGANMEVLHLWRPVNGDWCLLNDYFRKEGENQ